jgi:hypothetical protein
VQASDVIITVLSQANQSVKRLCEDGSANSENKSAEGDERSASRGLRSLGGARCGGRRGAARRSRLERGRGGCDGHGGVTTSGRRDAGNDAGHGGHDAGGHDGCDD